MLWDPRRNKGYTWDNLVKERFHDGLCLSLPSAYTSSDKFKGETKEEMTDSVLEPRDAQRGCEAGLHHLVTIVHVCSIGKTLRAETVAGSGPSKRTLLIRRNQRPAWIGRQLSGAVLDTQR